MKIHKIYIILTILTGCISVRVKKLNFDRGSHKKEQHLDDFPSKHMPKLISLVSNIFLEKWNNNFLSNF